ncbi:anaphase-promoting complex component Cut20/Apc4 [Xylariaceae sp. FL0804]|nr:anaphase-promoting complex component Cut20/Apc4 [Xylariaceae sp. FL0804]
MTEPIELKLSSEARLDPRPQRGLLTHNPSIELFAGAAGAKTLQIWRSNGQVVAKSSQRGDREAVEAVRWKPDGQFLAVGWSDGVVRLMGLETNKAVHQMAVCEPGKSKITCIGWARNKAGRRPDTEAMSSTTTAWEQLAAAHGLEADGEKSAAVDLPRELTFLEIETALPKISPLPASGGSGDDMFVFTTRASLEFLFRPLSPEDSDTVDVMIVGTNDGRVHLSIYDSFVIGTFDYVLPKFGSPAPPALQLCHHASHPELSTHMLVFRPAGKDKSKSLFVVPMDLTFVHSSPENLSLLASKTTTLQTLLRYVNQVQKHMVREWQSTRELPSKFLNSINETLREAGAYGGMNIGQAMYHSVVTGHTFPEVKEWLVDQLAERGHKRWDKAVVSGLQALRSLVHENFLPALERIGIILSRLLGIARFHESQEEIGFTSAQIMKVMDIISCLMLVGNQILLLVMEELELFHSFSGWLRHEIDRLASSSTSDELSEREASMEHGKILAYIQQYMPASPLRFYLSTMLADDPDRDRELAHSGGSLLDLLGRQIKKQEAGQRERGTCSQVEFLSEHLNAKAHAVFEGIAEAERRSVRFGQATRIELEHNVSKFDAVVSVSRRADALEGVTFTALTTEGEDSNVYLFRTTTAVTNGISGPVRTEVSAMTLGSGKVLDLKFLSDDSLLVLWALQGSPLRLVRIPHRSDDLGYRAYSSSSSSPSSTASGGAAAAAAASRLLPTPHVLSDDQVASIFPNMVVPADSSSSSSAVGAASASASASPAPPRSMEVRAASVGRGRLPPRLCLLAADAQTYRVFALPEEPEDE